MNGGFRDVGVAWSARPADGPALKSWVVEANDGIIATAGLLEGFAGAGADDQLLITAALAATDRRRAERRRRRSGPRKPPSATPSSPPCAYEQRLLAADPDDELAELVEHYRAEG